MTQGCSLPASSVYGSLQARILERVAILFSRDLLNPGIKSRSPVLQADSSPSKAQERPLHLGMESKGCSPSDVPASQTQPTGLVLNITTAVGTITRQGVSSQMAQD